MPTKKYFTSIPDGSQLNNDCVDGNCGETNCNEQVSGNDCVAPHNHDNLYYRKQEINEMFEDLGIGEGGEFIPAVLEEDVTSTVTEGNINAGDTIQQGTSFTEFVKTFLIKNLTPTTIAPSLTLNNNIGIMEVGSEVNLVISAVFNPGSIRGVMIGGVWSPNAVQGPRAGVPELYRYYTLNHGGDIIINTDEYTNSTNKAGHVVLPGIENFTVMVQHEAGPQPIDSQGNPFGTPLPAGQVSSATPVIGLYRTFFGPVTSVPSNGTELRAAPQNAFSNTTELTLNSGTTSIYFIIAVPPGRSLGSVIDLDASNQIITGDYVLVNPNFQGRDAGTGTVVYKLYVKTNGTPYTTNHRHLINLI